MDDRESHLEEIIANFSRYIAVKISEYNYKRYGIAQDDLFQEIYLKIWKTLADGHDIRHLPAYIRKIVNSVVINQILASRKEIRAIESNTQIVRELHGLSGRQKNNPFHSILLDSINSLKESQKTVLYLFLMDYDIDEIAKLKGWSKGKTNNIFYRAIKEIKKNLKDKKIIYED
jgi:RNA polymerase sigma factor (sigma-70 family)